MTYFFEAGDLLILVGIFACMGVAGVLIAEKMSVMRIVAIARGYDLRNGIYVQAFNKGLTGFSETFSVGERQYIVDREAASSYERWNRWGNNLPVYKYDTRDAIPLKNAAGKQIDAVKESEKTGKGKPMKTDYSRTPKPSSATTNLIFRRGGLKAMMQATKNVSMDPRLAGIAGAAIAGAGVYILLSIWHPGLVQPPPCMSPGYFCTPTPIPQNVTVVH